MKDSFDDWLTWIWERPHKWEKIFFSLGAGFFLFWDKSTHIEGGLIVIFLWVWFIADKLRNRNPENIWENPRGRK